jgi:hypothetical protein
MVDVFGVIPCHSVTFCDVQRHSGVLIFAAEVSGHVPVEPVL